MANAEHLDILLEGTKVWNEWRDNNSDVMPDLHGADLRGAWLPDANLYDADLIKVDLFHACLVGANLSGASLINASLRKTNLHGACLRKADLREADLFRADLSDADLRWAFLRGTYLFECDLENTDFEQAKCHSTVFANVDLSRAKGLEMVSHNYERSTIGIDTLFKSGGKIPERFLRGCGVPENVIALLKHEGD